MAQATTLPTPSVNTIKHDFEELPLFWQFLKGTPYRTARIDGRFEVSFGNDDKWHISDVWVKADNGQIGERAAEELIQLNADDHETFYWLVLSAIDTKYATRIDAWVSDELHGIPSHRRAA